MAEPCVRRVEARSEARESAVRESHHTDVTTETARRESVSHDATAAESLPGSPHNEPLTTKG